MDQATSDNEALNSESDGASNGSLSRPPTPEVTDRAPHFEFETHEGVHGRSYTLRIYPNGPESDDGVMQVELGLDQNGELLQRCHNMPDGGLEVQRNLNLVLTAFRQWSDELDQQLEVLYDDLAFLHSFRQDN